MTKAFSTGIDICSVDRMRLAIERGGARFLNRLFTKAEQTYCNRKRNKYENFAARFAAKEAVIKAHIELVKLGGGLNTATSSATM